MQVFTHYTCLSCGRTFEMQEPWIMQPNLCDPCGVALEKKRDEERTRLWIASRIAAFDSETPARYRQSDESRFPSCWAKVREWRPGGNGLVLRGATGVCKTRMLYALGRILSRLGHHVEVVNEAELADEVASGFGADQSYSKTVRRYLRAGVLIIDDLGTAKMTERMAATMYRIIEDRTANARPILASTNLHGDDLSKRMNDAAGAVVRRLREFCDTIMVARK